MTLLRAYDDDVSRLALESILALVIPPLTQRCLAVTNHITLMHKNANLCTPLFQIVDIAHSIISYRASEFLKEDLTLKEGSQHLEFSMASRSRHAQPPSGDLTSSRSLADFGLDTRAVKVAEFIDRPKDLFSVLSAEPWLKHEYVVPLMWHMRLQRGLTSLVGRQIALRTMYQAILVLLCCHPSSEVLADFFHDKTEVLSDFIYMLRTGPGTAEYDASVPFDIRLLACQCLVAVVGSRDTSAVSVMGRFSWLLHDLGVNKGQYMGLLPCLLRSSVSFVMSRCDRDYAESVSLGAVDGGAADTSALPWSSRLAQIAGVPKDIVSATPPTGLMSISSESYLKQRRLGDSFKETSPVTSGTLYRWIAASLKPPQSRSADFSIVFSPSYLTRLLWIEQIFIVTTAVISATTALPALMDSGFMSLIVSLLTEPAVRDSGDIQLSYVEATVVQLLELSVSESHSTMNIFRDMSGLEVLLDRLLFELNDISENSFVAAAAVVEGEEDTGGAVSAGKKRKKTESRHESAGRPSKRIAQDLTSSSGSRNVTPPRTGVYTLLPSRRVLVHSLMSVIAIYMQDGGDPRISHVLRGKKFTAVISLIFKNCRIFPSLILSFAFNILAEVINNDPGYLTHMLSSGVVAEAFSAMETTCEGCFFPLSSYSPLLTMELFNGMSALLSAVCLTADGMQLLESRRALDTFFKLMLDPRAYTPFTQVLMDEYPRQVGSNMEELLRHYPSLTKAATESLIRALNEASSAEFLSNIISMGISDENATLCQLHILTALLCTLQQLFQRKLFTETFVDSNGVAALRSALICALSPRRMFFSALSASTEPNTHSLGHYPVVKSISVCMANLCQCDTRTRVVLNTLFGYLSTALADVKAQASVYWQSKRDAESKSSDVQEQFLANILDSTPRKLMYEYVAGGELIPEVDLFALVMQKLVYTSYVVEHLASGLNFICCKIPTRGSTDTIESFMTAENCSLLQWLLKGMYVESQAELCRARGILARTSRKDRVKTHPLYRLVIVTNERVVVRESLEENSKKVCRLSKGSIVEAFERCSGPDNILRYRVAEGWISYYKNASSPEPQVQVVEVLQKSEEQLELEAKLVAEAPLNTAQKRFDFEKYANVTPRRGGFMAMFHFHCCMRHFLSVLSSNFVTTVSRPIPRASKMLLPLVKSVLFNLLPSIPYDNYLLRPVPAMYRKNNEMLDDFFVASEFPTIEEFSICDSFRSIHAVELCHHLLFDSEKKSYGESKLSALFLMHLMRDGFIEKLLHVSTLVFICCLHPDLDSRGASSSSFSQSQSTTSQSPLPRDDGDDDDAALLREAEEDKLNGLSDCGSSDDEDTKARRGHDRTIRERRMLAVTNVDIVIELWKLFFKSFSKSPSYFLDVQYSALTNLSDQTHYFNAVELRQKLFKVLLKFLHQVWSHDKLFTLPANSVKNVLDLVHIVLKSLSDVGGSTANPGLSLASSAEAERTLRGHAALRRQLMARTAARSQDDVLEEEFGIPDDLFAGMTAELPSDEIPFVRRPRRIGRVTRQAGETAQQPAQREDRGQEAATAAPDAADPAATAMDVCAADAVDGVPSSSSSSSGVLAEKSAYFVAPLDHLLPLGERLSPTDAEDLRKTMEALYRVVYQSVPASCLELISRGIRAPGVQWRAEAAIANSTISREDTTLMVLSMMRSCMERARWSLSTINVVQLSALYSPALKVLENRLSAQSTLHLYGLLHAILLVLVGPGLEVMYLLCSRNPLHRSLFPLLIEQMEKKIERLHRKRASTEAASAADTSSFDVNNRVSSWIAPALLILDHFAQPLLVDNVALLSNLRELERINSPSSESEGLLETPIIPSALCSKLRVEFSTDILSAFDFQDKSAETAGSAASSSATRRGRSGSIGSNSGHPRKRSASLNSAPVGATAENSSASGVTDRAPHFPLIDEGLDFELKKRCVKICLELIELSCAHSTNSDSKGSTPALATAASQFLCHLTRNRTLAEYFYSIDGINRILSVPQIFKAAPSFVYTLIIHVLEDEQYLQHTMEAAIKVCIHRKKAEDGDKKISLSEFSEIMAPLVFRDQIVFLKAMSAVAKVYQQTSSPSSCFVELKDSSEHNVSTNSGSAPSDWKTPTRKPSDEHASSQPSSHGAAAGPSPLTVKAILDCLVIRVLGQWQAVVSKGDASEVSVVGEPSAVPSLLGIADLLTLMGDLICSAPGFTTCVHKYQYYPTAKKTRANPSALLSGMKHSITGESLHSTYFLTFVIHTLLSCDIHLPARKVSKDVDANKKQEGIDPKPLKEAACYLLACLVARPGDGRRRVLKELLGVLKLSGCPLDTTNRLKVTSSVTQCLQLILNPRSTWRARQMLVMPQRDVLIAVVSLKAYGILSEALCAISLDHPLAPKVSELIAAELEYLVRKGIPTREEHLALSRTSDAPSGKASGQTPRARPTPKASAKPRSFATPSGAESSLLSSMQVDGDSLIPAAAGSSACAASSGAAGREIASTATTADAAAAAPASSASVADIDAQAMPPPLSLVPVMSARSDNGADDFFSPLISRHPSQPDRRDTLTTDDDRDDAGRLIEHQDTFENELRLLSEPARLASRSRMMGREDIDAMDEEDEEDEMHDDEDDEVRSGWEE
jgi:hypothetical protein